MGKVEEYLTKVEEQFRRRRISVLSPGAGPTVEISGKPVISMASNDYLGLMRHPETIAAAVDATQRFGAGAGASRLVTGSLPPHMEMEQALARFKGTAAALSFSSGYLANVGIIPALIGRGGLILADRLCHASLIDGCRLSGADFRIYRHGDIEHLTMLLSRNTSQRNTLIVTDGVFSMDGDLAPLPELMSLAMTYGAELYIDDAHGTGVMGTHGRGTVEHFGLESALPFHMGTLSKALGSSGGYVAGQDSSIQYFLNASRSFAFTTAPTPGSAAAVTAALAVIMREPERRARLWQNRAHLHDGLRGLGFRLTSSMSPIIPILIGNAETALAFSAKLLDFGVFAPAIRPPTVPESTSRIRVTVTSEHSIAQIDEALHAFKQTGRMTRVL
ncbi:8-amino-7-oxononanoate synthase [Nitrospira sp. KM1]|uniref:8-amino-7-oxononanoate synthase n=1 Tax=Nitrospira sp. KM1 TaxID=1936990 RepID=UPI0013A7ADDF|nr:8-amino-7-oxononanoate synthase [Nitrospira sp. KM1]BCA54491.1 8-amino-7-oxononanoate synthase [Nitrospira sp. KM1]